MCDKMCGDVCVCVRKTKLRCMYSLRAWTQRSLKKKLSTAARPPLQVPNAVKITFCSLITSVIKTSLEIDVMHPRHLYICLCWQQTASELDNNSLSGWYWHSTNIFNDRCCLSMTLMILLNKNPLYLLKAAWLNLSLSLSFPPYFSSFLNVSIFQSLCLSVCLSLPVSLPSV